MSVGAFSIYPVQAIGDPGAIRERSASAFVDADFGSTWVAGEV